MGSAVGEGDGWALGIFGEEVSAAGVEVVLGEKGGRKTGDVLLEGVFRVDLQELGKGDDEDFGHGVVDCKDGVGDESIFQLGEGGEDAIFMVVFIGPSAQFGVQG